MPTGVVMVVSTGAFGAYFKLTQGGPSNSSHVALLALPMEPSDASGGLAWLAVGSMCLFIAGEWVPPGMCPRLPCLPPCPFSFVPVMPTVQPCQQRHSGQSPLPAWL